MNGFRVVLCLAGLLTYLVTKHFTAPDESSLPPAAASQLLGVGLSIPDSQANDPAVLGWMDNSSNAEPALLRAELSPGAEIGRRSAKAAQKIHSGAGVVLPELGRN